MNGSLMTMAVVMPTWNETDTIAEIVTHTRALGFDECLVVDGGSTDGTPHLVRQLSESPANPPLSPIRCLTAPRGRAQQLNAGAESTQADVVIFLHADTRLPPDARRLIAQALADPACVGGRFDVQFDRPTWMSRTIAAFMNRRSRWTGMMTGDQAMFVRRTAFRQLGGFAPLPLMEDLELSRRLKRLGSVAALDARVTTSYRRWEREGPIRTMLRMWGLRFLYWLGVDPQRLVRYYRPIR